MIRIGLDVHVSKDVIQHLSGMRSFEIVVQAREAESDESWFARGRANGMTHVYSGDLDLFNLCKGTEVVFIRARPGRALRKQLSLIFNGISQGKSSW